MFALFYMNDLMKYQMYSPHTPIFSPVVRMNPTKEPIPDLSAVMVPSPFRSSPAIAPRNGPMMSPKGGKKSPTMSPTMLPMVPNLLPPTFFVSQAGRK